MPLFISRILFTLMIIIMSYFALHRIWTKNVDVITYLKKFSEAIPIKEEVEEPRITYKIQSLSSNYATGLVVYGIKWRQNFREYLIDIENQSNILEIADIRIDLGTTISGVLKCEIFSQEGIDNIQGGTETFPSGLVKDNKIVKLTSSPPFNIKINVGKIFPRGKLSLLLILAYIENLPPDYPSEGHFDIQYSYRGNQTDLQRVSSKHRILIDNNRKLTIGPIYTHADKPKIGVFSFLPDIQNEHN